jgi:hypothetical protein
MRKTRQLNGNWLKDIGVLYNRKENKTTTCKLVKGYKPIVKTQGKNAISQGFPSFGSIDLSMRLDGFRLNNLGWGDHFECSFVFPRKFLIPEQNAELRMGKAIQRGK